MARNLFQDPFQTGMDALDAGYERQQRATDQGTRVRAGRQLAGGDRSGASATFASAGMIPEARQMTSDQGALDENAYQHGRDVKEDEQKNNEAVVGHFKQVTGSARQLDGTTPEGLAKRKEFVLGALPILQEQTGRDMAAMIAQVQALPPEKFDDQNLSIFDGEIDKLQIVNRGGGGYDVVNQRTGAKVRGVDPTEKAPAGFEYDDKGGLQPIPGYVAGRKAISEATRAPPRPRAAARSSGRAAAPSGGGFDPNAIKWGQ